MSIQRNQILGAITKSRDASKKRRFEQTFELAINFRELDMKRPENRINLRVQLPNGIGGQKVLVSPVETSRLGLAGAEPTRLSNRQS